MNTNNDSRLGFDPLAWMNDAKPESESESELEDAPLNEAVQDVASVPDSVQEIEVSPSEETIDNIEENIAIEPVINAIEKVEKILTKSEKNPTFKDADRPVELSYKENAIMPDQTQQYLTFELAGEIYGVSILRVEEIKGWDKVTSIPNSPDYLQGVINLRGLIVPIIDLRKRFGMHQKPYTKTTVVIVVKVLNEEQERIMGLIVDAVADVHDLSKKDIKPAPVMHGMISNSFIQGLVKADKKMIIVLEIDAILKF